MVRKRLYLILLLAAALNGAEWAYPALSELVPPPQTITVYDHGRATPLDPHLVLYPSLLRACERVVAHAGPLRSPPPDPAAAADRVRRGDAVEVVYASPRDLPADGWTLTLDRLLIPLDGRGGDAASVLSGVGGYREAFAAVPADQSAIIRRYAADLVAVERVRATRPGRNRPPGSAP